MWLELKGKIGFLILSFYHHLKQVHQQINKQINILGSQGLWPTKFKFPSCQKYYPHFYTLPSFSLHTEGEATYLIRNIGKRFSGTQVAYTPFGSFTRNLPASGLCPLSPPLLGKPAGAGGSKPGSPNSLMLIKLIFSSLTALSIFQMVHTLTKPKECAIGTPFKNSKHPAHTKYILSTEEKSYQSHQ